MGVLTRLRSYAEEREQEKKESGVMTSYQDPKDEKRDRHERKGKKKYAQCHEFRMRANRLCRWVGDPLSGISRVRRRG